MNTPGVRGQPEILPLTLLRLPEAEQVEEVDLVVLGERGGDLAPDAGRERGAVEQDDRVALPQHVPADRPVRGLECPGQIAVHDTPPDVGCRTLPDFRRYQSIPFVGNVDKVGIMRRNPAPAELEPVEAFCNTATLLQGEDELARPETAGGWLRAHG